MKRQSLAVALALVIAQGVARSQPAPQHAPQPKPQTTNSVALQSTIEPVHIVFVNATAKEWISALSALSKMKISLGPNINPMDLQPLSVVASNAPFYPLLLQIAQTEGLAVQADSDGYILTLAPLSTYPTQLQAYTNASAQLPAQFTGGMQSPHMRPSTEHVSPAPIASQSMMSLSASAPFNGVGSVAGGAANAAQNQQFQLGVPTAGAQNAAIGQARAMSTNGGIQPYNNASVEGQNNSQIAFQLPYVLDYIIEWATTSNPNMEIPDRLFPELRTENGSLQYLATIAEAFTHLSPALANKGGKASSPTMRLTSLLDRAENIRHQACQRSTLETEILILQTRISHANQSVQPAMRTILQSRRQELSEMKK